ncbi:MAG TPA: NAD(P)H-dependent oxidoreductase [Candidatus Saccharimonadales bacterium]|nr:NAD(P)H-dependent oxidoreductase [Candidatus Saccharimonadales bacterium]
MDEKLTIAVLAGTKRVKRESITAAQYVAEFGRQLPGVDIIFVDPGDFDFPGDGNDPEGKDPKYTQITAKADAFFIVAPEYNHSFPGTLKRMLDSELENYKHKPVALAGTSNGAWGGTRCVEALALTVREMGLVATSWSVYFPRVQDMFDESGALRPEFIAYAERNVGDAYKELIWMAKTLKWGRANLTV